MCNKLFVFPPPDIGSSPTQEEYLGLEFLRPGDQFPRSHKQEAEEEDVTTGVKASASGENKDDSLCSH